MFLIQAKIVLKNPTELEFWAHLSNQVCKLFYFTTSIYSAFSKDLTWHLYLLQIKA